ncbi:MAG: acetyltransferase [Colwellia sp.]|jgi:sugar O-acyltransferase, sialic acid O-acetyltransferase NeuD family
MPVLAILGASGHGKVVAEAAFLSKKWTDIVFFDDAHPSMTVLESWLVVGNTQDLLDQSNSFDGVMVAIGNNAIRLLKQSELQEYGCNIVSIIHPLAIISPSAKISCGSVVMAGAIINPFCHIGGSCIINTGATVDHDCQLGEGVHISPGVNLAGEVKVGALSWLGIGSCVKQQVQIGKRVVVGVGSAVVSNIMDDLTVVGVPAKPLISK